METVESSQSDWLDCPHLAVVEENMVCRLCGALTTFDLELERYMTDQTGGDDIDWGDTQDAAKAAGQETAPVDVYPEFNDNPHNHRFTISVTGAGAPMVVVRANTASEVNAAFNELEAYGAWANVGAAHAALKAQGTLGAGMGPVTPMQGPTGPPLPPQGQYASPPPQQSYPVGPPVPSQGPPPFGATPPGYVNPGSQPPPQQYGNGGGGWGQQQGGNSRDPKPRPAGWAMVDIPFADKDRFKALRAQGTQSADYLRGKVQWGGKGTYWLDPSVAQWVAQQGFPVQP